MLIIFSMISVKQFSRLLVNPLFGLQLILFIKISDTKMHPSQIVGNTLFRAFYIP